MADAALDFAASGVIEVDTEHRDLSDINSNWNDHGRPFHTP
ncbi:hypothetical protein [Lacisediminihabitans sp. H27-G8]